MSHCIPEQKMPRKISSRNLDGKYIFNIKQALVHPNSSPVKKAFSINLLNKVDKFFLEAFLQMFLFYA